METIQQPKKKKRSQKKRRTMSVKPEPAPKVAKIITANVAPSKLFNFKIPKLIATKTEQADFTYSG